MSLDERTAGTSKGEGMGEASRGGPLGDPRSQEDLDFVRGLLIALPISALLWAVIARALSRLT